MEKPLQGRGDTGQQSWPDGHSSVACIQGVPSARGHRGPSVTQEPWLSWAEPQYPATVPPTKQSRSLGTPAGLAPPKQPRGLSGKAARRGGPSQSTGCQPVQARRSQQGGEEDRGREGLPSPGTWVS